VRGKGEERERIYMPEWQKRNNITRRIERW